MQDREGRELEIDQEVMMTWGNDLRVYRGTVVGFTKVMVRVQYQYSPRANFSTSLKRPEYLIITSN